ncbi:unnamed protein product, partial [Mesorhabditis spiculigera]
MPYVDSSGNLVERKPSVFAAILGFFNFFVLFFYSLFGINANGKTAGNRSADDYRAQLRGNPGGGGGTGGGGFRNELPTNGWRRMRSVNVRVAPGQPGDVAELHFGVQFWRKTSMAYVDSSGNLVERKWSLFEAILAFFNAILLFIYSLLGIRNNRQATVGADEYRAQLRGNSGGGVNGNGGGGRGGGGGGGGGGLRRPIGRLPQSSGMSAPPMGGGCCGGGCPT